jgi:hypothetical protein
MKISMNAATARAQKGSYRVAVSWKPQGRMWDNRARFSLL